MNHENHAEEDSPSRKGARAARDTVLIEKKSYRNRAHDLRHPVDEVVQGSRTNIEQCIVVLVKFFF